MEYTSVRDSIKAYLYMNGMNVSDLAKMMNLPYSIMYAMLSGRRVMQLEEFHEICLVLGQSINVFGKYQSQ